MTFDKSDGVFHGHPDFSFQIHSFAGLIYDIDVTTHDACANAEVRELR